jgi:probable rRNA maturation factor
MSGAPQPEPEFEPTGTGPELEGERTMLELEVIGHGLLDPDGPSIAEIRTLCELALASAGIEDGHLAVQFVEADRIQELNRDFREKDTPTDVLSFGVDEDEEPLGPRELGDIFICPEYTADIREAVVHGTLHLTGMDHETDEGEMLALQDELLRWAQR